MANGVMLTGSASPRTSRPGIVRLLVTVAGLACAGCASADAPADSPPPGAPIFAVIETLEGAPADSAGGREFWAALRGAFTRTSFETQRPAGRAGEYASSVPISNRFALLEGSGAAANPDAYRVHVSLEWLKPPAVRRTAPHGKRKLSGAPVPAASDTTAPRAFVAVVVWPPGVDPAVVRIAAASDTVTFRARRTPHQAYAASVGRNAALLALEHLHHLSGDLAEDERLKLDHAERRRDVGGGPVHR